MTKKLLLFVFLIAGAIGLYAQTISGNVTDLTGAGITNYQVYIINNDSMNPYSSSTYTAGGGAYSFSNVPSSSSGFVVYVYDCQQSMQTVNLAANSGTANFSICTSNPSSCTAVFYSTPDSSNANLIYFTDLSSGNPTSWSWSFGDGSGSSSQNPSHTYGASGTYTVTLNISSANCSDSYTTTVTVGNVVPSCVADFYSYADSNNVQLIQFIDNSAGSPTSWSWDFGDGATASTQNPNHTYAATGSYNVTLSISSANCSDTYTTTVVVGNVTPGCIANFTFAPDSNNTSLIHFYDASTGNPTNWMWDFGDGNTSSLQNPFHSYASSGTYNVSLIITGNNCQSSYNANVIVSGSVLSYTVEGSIYANNLVVTAVDVDLFDVTNNVVAYSTRVSPMGTYNFANVVAGTYIVLATPDTTVIPGYAPTYYGNVIFWSAATQLNVNANQSGININLVAIPVTPGSGSISGTVSTGNKSSVENLNVYLTDDNNSDVLVASTTTNSNGEYILSNIADGTFKIWVNVSGKTTTPITVILDNGNAESEENDFIMTNNTIVPKTTSIESNSIEGSMNLYPNPVVNTLNVEMNIEKAAVCTFNVYSISGQLMSSQQLNVNNGESLIRINTNALAQGTYILRIENNVNQTLQKLFVK